MNTSDLANAWRDFWFRPQPAYALGLVRIVFGLIAVAWTLSLLPDLTTFFGTDGIVPRQPRGVFQVGVFEYWTGDRALLVGWAVLLISAVLMTVGWHSRLAALLVFVLVVSFELRCPYIFNSGDNLIRIEALFLALAPSGAALSLDQYRRTGVFWSAQMRAPWSLRLMQIQLTLIYVATFVVRMNGEKWSNGTAMSYALRLEDMQILAVPQSITTSPLLMNVTTWGTMVGELLIGILIWNRRCRPVVIAAGVVLHSVIMVTVAVGFFTPAMFVLYLAFVSPDTVRQLPDTVKSTVNKQLSRLRRRRPTVKQKPKSDSRELEQVPG